MELSSDQSNNTYVPHLYSRLLKLQRIYSKLDPNGNPLIKLKQQIAEQLRNQVKQQISLYFGDQKEMPKLITSASQQKQYEMKNEGGMDNNEQKRVGLESDKQHVEQKLGGILQEMKETQRQFALKVEAITQQVTELGNKLQITENKLSSLYDLIPHQQQPIHKQKVVANDIIQSAINISDKCPFYTAYKFTDSIIQYIGKDRTATQLLSSTTIKLNSITTFELKVIKTQSSCIKFGVLDKNYMGQRSCWNYPNTVYYHGWGHVMTGGEEEQYPYGGFKSGDWLRMIVNLKEGKIVWAVRKDCLKLKQWVQEQYLVERKANMLKNPNIEWIPFIAMYNKGDKVQWRKKE